MASPADATPVQSESSGRGGGRGRGGGGGQRRGGGGRGGNKQGGSADSTEAQSGARFSALGNPLPPLAGAGNSKPSGDVRVTGQSGDVRASPSGDARVPPPSINRFPSAGSNASSTGASSSDRGNNSTRGGGSRGGHGRESRRGGGGGGAQHQSMPRPSVDNSRSAPNAATPVTEKPMPVPRASSAVSSTGSVRPELPQSADWGDDEDEVAAITHDTSDSRSKLLLDRALSEKAELSKKLSDQTNELEKQRLEMAKLRAELEGLKGQVEKAAVIEKSYATLRQTRDTLEAERDTLKKNLAKAEKDAKSVKDDLDKHLARYKVEMDSLNAQVEYYKLESEDSRGGAPPRPAQSEGQAGRSWLNAVLKGTSVDRIADALGFSTLELARVHVEAWADEAGFRRSVASLVFERAGEQINVDSPTFGKDAVEALGRALSQVEVLVFVAQRPASVPEAAFGSFITALVRMLTDARALAARSGRNMALVVEDYPFNRYQLDQTRFIPVNFLLV